MRKFDPTEFFDKCVVCGNSTHGRWENPPGTLTPLCPWCGPADLPVSSSDSSMKCDFCQCEAPRDTIWWFTRYGEWRDVRICTECNFIVRVYSHLCGNKSTPTVECSKDQYQEWADSIALQAKRSTRLLTDEDYKRLGVPADSPVKPEIKVALWPVSERSFVVENPRLYKLEKIMWRFAQGVGAVILTAALWIGGIHLYQVGQADAVYRAEHFVSGAKCANCGTVAWYHFFNGQIVLGSHLSCKECRMDGVVTYTDGGRWLHPRPKVEVPVDFASWVAYDPSE